MRKGESTKAMLVLEAFKLFATKPYDQVTLSDVEKASHLSRGALLYHFKTKEQMFADVITTYIFGKNSVSTIPAEHRATLRGFIAYFMQSCRYEKEVMRERGITNVNYALLNVESSAFYFYPDMNRLAKQWHEQEKGIWREVIENAIASGEIQSDVNAAAMASVYTHLYVGMSYLGIIEEKGYDIDKMEQEFLAMYERVRH
jgi:AcrR family transcriptional regulator